MRISDWISDVCSSDLNRHDIGPRTEQRGLSARTHRSGPAAYRPSRRHAARMARGWRRSYAERRRSTGWHRDPVLWTAFWTRRRRAPLRSEEHTSELQSLMRISYAVFCLQKKKQQKLSKNPLQYNAYHHS